MVSPMVPTSSISIPRKGEKLEKYYCSDKSMTGRPIRIYLFCLSANVYLFLSCLPCLNAQSFAYEQIGIEEGLPASEVLAICQDEEGAMWIATNPGLSRFDGFYFDQYFQADNMRLGKIHSIQKDPQGFLWFGGENGLFVLRNHQLHQTLLSGRQWFMQEVFPDEDGSLWMACLDGLYHLPVEQADSIRNGHNPLVPPEMVLSDWPQKSQGDMRVQAICRGPENGIFFTTDFFVFRWEAGQYEVIWGDNTRKDDYITIKQIDDKIYWGAIPGFYRYQQGKVTFLPGSDGYGKKILAYKDEVLMTTSTSVFRLEKDSLHFLIFPEAFDLIQLNTLAKDREDNLWLGSWEGVLKAAPSVFDKFSIPNIPVFGITADSLGQLLIGTAKGKGYIWSNQTAIPYINGKSAGLDRAEITSMATDRFGNEWFASAYQGLLWRSDQGLKHFTAGDGLGDNSFFFMLSLNNEKLLVGGDGGVVLITPDTKGGTFQRFDFEPQEGDYVVFNSGFEVDTEDLLLGSDHGLFRWNATSGLSPVQMEGLDAFEPNIRKIVPDGAGAAFLATLGNGIMRISFGSTEKTIKRDSAWMSTYPIQEKVWLDLEKDHRGDLWAASFRELCLFPKEQQARPRCFDRTDGFFQASYPDVYLQKQASGKMYAGCSNGLISFHPDSVTINHKTNVQLRKVVLLPENRPIYEWNQANNLSTVHLAPQENSLRFQFSAMHFRNRKRTSFEYRLLPLEPTWQYIEGKTEVSYRQLPPGNYTFEIRSGSNPGSNAPVVFPFEVFPPFWMRGWFFALFSIFLFGVLWWVYDRRQKLRQNRISRQTLDYFATSTYGENTEEEILWDTARNAVISLGLQDCVVYLIEGNSLIQKAAFGPKKSGRRSIKDPIQIPVGSGISGSVAASGIPEIVKNTRKDARYIIDDEERLSEICVPIKHEDQVIGVIDCEHPTRDYFTKKHLQTLQILASLCANKLVKSRVEQEVRQQEKSLLELNKRMAETRLMAVRAQMNPHFIFNSLNAIQECILSEKVDAAFHYLSRFSRLLRLVLDYSGRNYIRLDQEINLLNLYLELEKMRFDEDFVYEIRLDQELVPDAYRMPSLLIQPFVENAIWHGLLPKKGARELRIEFSLQEEDFLKCTIEDNGIGRTASMDSKKDRLHLEKHESKGITLARERLDAISQQTNLHTNIEVQDLYHADGQAAGTRVIILLPGI
ncbi:MAG: GAF domain-containing protein [Bacteroidetes bacterium]|nr:GAF domain-containing protein [Bacteroidota bacterium]